LVCRGNLSRCFTFIVNHALLSNHALGACFTPASSFNRSNAIC
jgi:hypothetical protein